MASNGRALDEKKNNHSELGKNSNHLADAEQPPTLHPTGGDTRFLTAIEDNWPRNGPQGTTAQLENDESEKRHLLWTFKQTKPEQTVGVLTIRRGSTVVLQKRMDIADEMERWTLLNELSQQEQPIPTDEAIEIWKTLPILADNVEDGRATKEREPEIQEVANSENIMLPVKGLNIPFADVALQDGDKVEVLRLELPLFTVIGLVQKPGNFPYSPDAQYNLMQALAFAGGLDREADPYYATIYRLGRDGSIVRVPVEIIDAEDGSRLTNAWNTRVKPGDIVAVEHTPRTRTNVFLERLFRINVGAYVPLNRW
jgi:ribosomal protein S28E/S33